LATERVLIHGVGLAILSRKRLHSLSIGLNVARALATTCSNARADAITSFCAAAPCRARSPACF